MLRKMIALAREEDAQGMTEYILIVALIALAAIVAVRMFGKQLAGLFSSKANELQDAIGTPTGD